jgi:hypothetical protein
LATASPSPGATSSGDVTVTELPGPRTALAPGRYAKSSFQPYITFEVGEGWTTEQQSAGFFDIQDDPGSPDVVAVQWANVQGAETPEDVVNEILEKTDLRVSDPVPVAIDGITGLRVIVDTTDPADTDPPVFHPVLTVTPGPLSIASGRRLEATLLDMDGSVLAVLVGGSVAEWDRALEMSRPVLDSMTIAY